jgi:hypothetical protein
VTDDAKSQATRWTRLRDVVPRVVSTGHRLRHEDFVDQPLQRLRRFLNKPALPHRVRQHTELSGDSLASCLNNAA